MGAEGRRQRTSVGIAYSGSTPAFVREYPEAVDYVEIPFELLRHDSGVLAAASPKPIVLHCASLSIAGSVPPAGETVAAVREWLHRTRSPWLGEHLSFITADREEAGEFADAYAPGEPYNIGYTVSPPLNEGAVDLVLRSIRACRSVFDVPLLLENPPLYFRPPGSTMSQVEFIRELCARSPVRLLLDLAHFCITGHTMGFDPARELQAFPLERVVEVHISGVDVQSGGHWDNHASRAPDIEFELLAQTLRAAPVRGITLEYNWSTQFPAGALLDELARTRAVLAGASA